MMVGTRRISRHRQILTPEQIVEAAQHAPADRILACSARCIQCAGSAEAVRYCERRDCALHFLRPYQRDVPPRGARHIALRAPVED